MRMLCIRLQLKKQNSFISEKIEKSGVFSYLEF